MDPAAEGWPGVVARPSMYLRSALLRKRRKVPQTGCTVSLTPVDGQPLGHDILVSVMHAAGLAWLWPEVVALMKTCKELYHEGTRLLLTETVDLRGHGSIASFTSFILHANSALLPHFHNRLSIWVNDTDYPVPDDVCKSFPQAISRSTHLRSLHILHLNPLLQTYPDLLTAFLSLPALEDLYIRIWVEARHMLIAKFLRGLRCPLKCLRLQCFVRDHGKNVDYRREADPLWLCAGVAATLETLALTGLVQMGTTHSYPNVKNFHMEVGLIPILRPIITSFPALRTLVSVPRPLPSNYAEISCFMVDYSGKGHWAPKDENVPTWKHSREANRRDQLVNGSWDTLDTLISNSLVACTLGLICHVRRVHLLLQFDSLDKRVIITLISVLRDTRPHCLRLAFYRVDIDLVLHMMEHVIYVRDYLSELELRLNISEGSFDAKQYLNQLVHALRFSNIFSLRIELVCFKEQFARTPTECSNRCWQEFLREYCIMEDTIRAADVRKVAKHFITTLPDLRYIEIWWGSCYMPYGLDGGGVGINLDVGPETYDIPAEAHPDDWDATW
ncbi:hypothetical protein K466DRAFT_665257 [Polyporus arcularius HHB13444]|uniref:F-box domain-containing protein n=1 Tax=Polyporus arcularius HHB13444 TaxID=1314778 RepID=A0A5C3P6Q6_9APHY|nr:hypothetical protein K466DRAFT_665257 [Polyporus arcularius HHB13444]